MSTCKPQKHPKNTVKTRLIIFSVLAIVLVVCAFFSEYLTPYDPYLQNLDIAESTFWARTGMAGICCPGLLRAAVPVFFQRSCWSL